MSTCKPKLTLEEKELAILRESIDIAEKRKGKQTVSDPDVKKIISILEDFLKKKKLVCYGGTAINNILPLEDQFYNKDIEIPDYDFYSPSALEDAKELADIYYDYARKVARHRPAGPPPAAGPSVGLNPAARLI